MSIAVNGPRRIERGLTTLVTGLLVIGLSACTGGAGGLNGSPDQPPLTLTVSEAYTQANPDEARKQLTQLQGAIDRLRKATSSGWTGRQDDETGYLAELSGGRYSTGAASVPGVVGAFFGDYGLELFGIGIAELELEVPAAGPADGTTIVRAAQLIAGVPVLDGELQLTITSSDAETRLNTVRGRVFPGLQLSTTPTISAARATQVIRRLSGAEVPRAPQLVVVPEGFGVLAWQATAVGNSQTQGGTGLPTNANYFIDAATGEVVTIRAGSAHADIAYRGGNRADETVTRHSVSTAPSVGETVEVTGNNQLTGPITAVGTVRNDGLVTLKDTSVPSYDAGTGAGGIETYDASEVSSDEDLPGQVITSTSAEIGDGDAIAAHAYARFVYDYYGELGRLSWDGAGGTLVSAVNFGPPDFCNAFFSSDLVPPQMVYGETCTVDGVPQATAGFSIDTAGHEITHGVTDSSSSLIYSGQAGALNESFSDYFGNIIGNLWYGNDSDAYSEHRCEGVVPPTLICLPNPDGTASARFLPNGSTLDDYVRLLEPGFRARLLQLDDQDNAGVHSNSAVWNNSLWSIRKRLAQVDQAPGNESGLARDFDKIVYHVLTQRLVPSSGFLDARAAIEETIAEAGADPVMLRVAREIFEQNLICSGCGDQPSVPGIPVATTSGSEQAPTVSGDLIAWLDTGAGDGVFGSPTSAIVGEQPAGLGDSSDTVSVVLVGSSRMVIGVNGAVSLTDETGQSTELGRTPGVVAVRAGLAGSDMGGAWIDDTQVHFRGYRRDGGQRGPSSARGTGRLGTGDRGGSGGAGYHRRPGFPLASRRRGRAHRPSTGGGGQLGVVRRPHPRGGCQQHGYVLWGHRLARPSVHAGAAIRRGDERRLRRVGRSHWTASRSRERRAGLPGHRPLPLLIRHRNDLPADAILRAARIPGGLGRPAGLAGRRLRRRRHHDRQAATRTVTAAAN